jgi:ElaA protein
MIMGENMTVEWEWQTIPEMNSIKLYKIMQHRGKIFAVEQNEAYLDADGKDIDAWHLMGWRDNTLIAYARVLLPKEDDLFVRFGRLSVALEYRGQGYGYQLVEQILSHISNSEYFSFPLQIFSQTYLVKMYEKFGFHPHGEPFNMGRIPHVKMDRSYKI